MKRVQSTLFKLDIKLQDSVYGIIGCGAIGEAICHYLLTQYCCVHIYDEDKQKTKKVKNIFSTFQHNLTVHDNKNIFFNNVNIIFGCTGKDITKDTDLLKDITQGSLIFISCSSEDTEFNTLLRQIASSQRIPLQPLADITYKKGHYGNFRILRGGFPINFDGGKESALPEDIEITLALLLGSCLQAIRITCELHNPNFQLLGKQRVEPQLQSAIALHWLAKPTNKQRYGRELISRFYNMAWISHNSVPPDADNIIAYIPDERLVRFAKLLESSISASSSLPPSPPLQLVSKL